MAKQTHRLIFIFGDYTDNLLRSEASRLNCSMSEVLRRSVQAFASGEAAVDISRHISPDLYEVLDRFAREHSLPIMKVVEALIRVYLSRAQHLDLAQLTELTNQSASGSAPVRIYLDHWAISVCERRAHQVGWSVPKFMRVFMQTCLALTDKGRSK